jgi:hypothetical protein
MLERKAAAMRRGEGSERHSVSSQNRSSASCPIITATPAISDEDE